MTTTLKLKWVKTRKPHNCHGCNREMPKGSRMRYWVVVDAGDFGSDYYCEVCESLWLEKDSWAQEEGHFDGDLKGEDEDGWEERRNKIEEQTP